MRADLVFVTNIPTPYRTAFFNALRDACDLRGLGLHVLYCARTEPRRFWPFAPSENRYSYEFLRGWAPTVANLTMPFNPGVRARLAKLRPQVVVHAGAWNMPTNLLALAPPKRPWRALFWSEGHRDNVIHDSGPVALARRAALGRYDGFVVPNARSREWCEAQAGGAREIHLLPNTVDEDFWRRQGEKEREAARSALRLGPRERIVVQVGYVENMKGSLDLARAFAEAPQAQRRDARLVFVGSGRQVDSVTSVAKGLGGSGVIQITGQLGRDQVRSWLMAADAFALNTKRDANPLTAVEACFAGLPLLLSAKAGNVDEVLGNANGIVILDPERPDGALRSMLEAPLDRLRRMGEISRERAEASFRRDSVCEAFLSGLALCPMDTHAITRDAEAVGRAI